jgi:hypothetical protein
MNDELAQELEIIIKPFEGWATTLMDALDTFRIVGMGEEFEKVVFAVPTTNFTVSTDAQIIILETTIRCLGVRTISLGRKFTLIKLWKWVICSISPFTH